MSGEYERLRKAIAGERMPLVLVDLDAVERNVQALVDGVRAAGKSLRLATKSVRCPELIDFILESGGSTMRGLMSYAVEEAAFLVERGATDVLVAYPSVQTSDLELLVELNRRPGVQVAIVVDCGAQLDRIEAGAQQRGGSIPVVVEVDLSLRAARGKLHLGVRRSPVRSADEVVALAEAIRARSALRFAGVMGYEAQVAGLTDASPFSRALNPAKALIKRVSLPMIRQRRQAVADALAARGIELELFNGGGTGSLALAQEEPAVTELTAGSGFLCSHLFDYYRHLRLEPAAFFAIQVVRKPDPGFVTCHGGGFVASGEAGADRLPLPAYPEGLSLTTFEAAGEVQTPVTGPGTRSLEIGDPVFFRHAKAGELAEHFNEYLLLRAGRIVARAPTYRGLGKAFL